MTIIGMLVQCAHYKAEKKRKVVVRHPYMVATQDEVIIVEATTNEVI